MLHALAENFCHLCKSDRLNVETRVDTAVEARIYVAELKLASINTESIHCATISAMKTVGSKQTSTVMTALCIHQLLHALNMLNSCNNNIMY